MFKAFNKINISISWFYTLTFHLTFHFNTSPLTFKQTVLCSLYILSSLKHSKQYLQKCFFSLRFVVLYVNLLKFLITNIMWVITMYYQKQIHKIFNIFIWYIDWINQSMLIIKHINTDLDLDYNLTIIFLVTENLMPS